MVFTYLPIPGSSCLKSSRNRLLFAVVFSILLWLSGGSTKNGGDVLLDEQYLAGFKFRLALPSCLVGSFLTHGEAPFGSSIK